MTLRRWYGEGEEGGVNDAKKDRWEENLMEKEVLFMRRGMFI